MRHHWWPVCLVALAAGCGASGRELGTVSGRVTLDGKPLEKARVNFQPQSAERNTGVGSYALTDANGDYTLKLIDDSAAGAFVGTHRVMIKAPSASKGNPEDDKVRAGPDRVPAEYNVNSTLTYDVKPGHNTADWKLETKKK
jgi:hypothetical protein